MPFEPQKFFLNLVGFFSIIMPGALLAYLGMDFITGIFPPPASYERGGWVDVLVFLFVAYLLGHLVFLLGSFLDDLVYSPLRGATWAGQVERLAKGRPRTHRLLRRFAASHWLFGSGADGPVLLAQRMKGAALTPLGAEKAINAYQWTKVRLSREHPEGLVAVERLEADSKFFRSLAVVLVLLGLLFVGQGRGGAALACFALIVPALWRYVDQRFKATQHAYWHVIELERLARAQPDAAPAIAERRADGLTHAGGVVYRSGAAGTEYLLVETSTGGEWVLPKGHIEPFEPPEQTAVREVHEESGVWARVKAHVADIDLYVKGEHIAVRFYLMEALEQESPGGEGRGQRWRHFIEAIAEASHEETRQLLAEADRLRSRQEPTP